MELDEARALKRQLVGEVEAELERLRARQGVAARPAKALSPIGRSCAVGITTSRKSGYQIAVRVQRRSLDRELIRRFRKMTAREVDVRYVGRVAKLAESPPGWMTTRVRPLRIGASIGHYAITAGTLGAFVDRRSAVIDRDRPNDVPSGTQTEPLILSNNHVLADENAAQAGDPILQPGRFDGGTDADRVASLESFVALDINGTNAVDAAIARVDDGIEFDLSTLEGGTLLVGAVDLVESGVETVRKTGRTTGLTEGRITAFDIDNLVVAYDIGNVRFDDQLEIESTMRTPFSRGGDSGSLIVAASQDDPTEARAGGLLFAGSDQGGRLGLGLTYANPLRAALSALDVELALEQDRPVSSLPQARAAKERVKEMLGGREELRGVGITRVEDGYALKINLSQRTELSVPSEIDGVPVIIEVVGEIRRLSTSSVTSRRRAGIG